MTAGSSIRQPRFGPRDSQTLTTLHTRFLWYLFRHRPPGRRPIVSSLPSPCNFQHSLVSGEERLYAVVVNCKR
jgi:hypothetical protein